MKDQEVRLALTKAGKVINDNTRICNVNTALLSKDISTLNDIITDIITRIIGIDKKFNAITNHLGIDLEYVPENTNPSEYKVVKKETVNG